MVSWTHHLGSITYLGITFTTITSFRKIGFFFCTTFNNGDTRNTFVMAGILQQISNHVRLFLCKKTLPL